MRGRRRMACVYAWVEAKGECVCVWWCVCVCVCVCLCVVVVVVVCARTRACGVCAHGAGAMS